MAIKKGRGPLKKIHGSERACGLCSWEIQTQERNLLHG